jgi:hypothetical protein
MAGNQMINGEHGPSGIDLLVAAVVARALEAQEAAAAAAAAATEAQLAPEFTAAATQWIAATDEWVTAGNVAATNTADAATLWEATAEAETLAAAALWQSTAENAVRQARLASAHAAFLLSAAEAARANAESILPTTNQSRSRSRSRSRD